MTQQSLDDLENCYAEFQLALDKLNFCLKEFQSLNPGILTSSISERAKFAQEILKLRKLC